MTETTAEYDAQALYDSLPGDVRERIGMAARSRRHRPAL